MNKTEKTQIITKTGRIKKSYECKYCNYFTTNKTDYFRHLKRKKHLNATQEHLPMFLVNFKKILYGLYGNVLLNKANKKNLLYKKFCENYLLFFA